MRSLRERRLRRRDHDYRRHGPYFITTCTLHRRHVFGRVVDGVMELNDAGRAVLACWAALPLAFPGLRLGAIVVMPNHVHAILTLPFQELQPATSARRGFSAGSLGAVVGRFKGAVTRAIGAMPGTLWQTRFHDRILRTPEAFGDAEEYIALNPERWSRDPINHECRLPENERDWEHGIRRNRSSHLVR